MSVIAYTYEADHHCEACTVARFGLQDGPVIIPPSFDGCRDSEGNEVGAVFSWDEWQQVGPECQTLSCGDCGRVLDEYRPLDLIEDDARAEGRTAGGNAASWLLDGNSSEDAARRLLQGIEDGDPEIMDALPSAPFSGEWADGLLPRDFLQGYGMSEDDPAADDVLRAFEDGYSEGVQDGAETLARTFLGV